MAELDRLLPGRITTHIRRPHRSKWKTAYAWTVRGYKCLDFLKVIRPYLIAKTKQADLIQKHYKAPGSDQRKLWLRVKELNRRGPRSSG